MFVRPLDSAAVVVAAATAAAVATPPAAQPKPLTFPFFSLFLLPVHCAAEVLPGALPFYPFPPLLLLSLLSRLPTSLFPINSLLFCCSSTFFLLLFHPLSILSTFLPHFPRRCVCSHLPVFPRVFSALRCVCVAPALICFSFPPSLPSSLPSSLPPSLPPSLPSSLPPSLPPSIPPSSLSPPFLPNFPCRRARLFLPPFCCSGVRLRESCPAFTFPASLPPLKNLK